EKLSHFKEFNWREFLFTSLQSNLNKCKTFKYQTLDIFFLMIAFIRQVVTVDVGSHIFLSLFTDEKLMYHMNEC
ncbi:hypothetical protein LINGRAPRIM_LOCUS3394, partial [Linum grandiflorum]